MRPRSTPLIGSLAAGMAAGLLAGLAMNLFARATLSVSGREAPDASPGADRTGRGMQPPQAKGRAEDDAAVRAGTAALTAVTGTIPSPETRRASGVAAHYAFSAMTGALYGLLSAAFPAIRAGRGTLYGAAVWIAADEIVTPALGLARPRRSQSAALQAYTLTGHLVYGCTLDTVLDVLQSDPNA